MKRLELLNHALFSLHEVDQHTEGKCKGFVINIQKNLVGFTGQKLALSPI